MVSSAGQVRPPRLMISRYSQAQGSIFLESFKAAHMQSSFERLLCLSDPSAVLRLLVSVFSLQSWRPRAA